MQEREKFELRRVNRSHVSRRHKEDSHIKPVATCHDHNKLNYLFYLVVAVHEL